MINVDYFYEDNEIGNSIEDSQIAELLINHLKPLYSNFEDWLDRSINEIKIGRKVAVGAWPGSSKSNGLRGICILKKISSSILEIKTLFVKEYYRGRVVDFSTGENGKISDQLMKLVYRLAEQQDFDSLLIDIPANNIQILRFLISHDFYFQLKHDNYGSTYYRMKKDIPKKYVDDVFDPQLFSKWVLKSIGVEKISEKNISKFKNDNINNKIISFEGTYSIGSSIMKIVEDVKVNVSTPIESKTGRFSIEIIRKSNDNIMFKRDWPIEDLLNVSGINPDTWDGFFNKKSGLVTPIRKSFFERLIMVEDNRKAFFKTGFFGKILLDQPNPGATIFFQDADKPNIILGHGHINDIIWDNPKNLCDQFVGLSGFSPDEFYRYSHIRNKMTAILIKDLIKSKYESPLSGRIINWTYLDESAARNLHNEQKHE